MIASAAEIIRIKDIPQMKGANSALNPKTVGMFVSIVKINWMLNHIDCVVKTAVLYINVSESNSDGSFRWNPETRVFTVWFISACLLNTALNDSYSPKSIKLLLVVHEINNNELPPIVTTMNITTPISNFDSFMFLTDNL